MELKQVEAISRVLDDYAVHRRPCVISRIRSQHLACITFDSRILTFSDGRNRAISFRRNDWGVTPDVQEAEKNLPNSPMKENAPFISSLRISPVLHPGVIRADTGKTKHFGA